MKSFSAFLGPIALAYTVAGLNLQSGARAKRSQKTSLELADQRVIFDLGMNTGIDTERWLEQGYKVVAVEANPLVAASTAAKPIEKKALKDGRLILLNIGIENSQASGQTLDFWVPELHVDASNSSAADVFGLRKSNSSTFTGSGSTDDDSIRKYGEGKSLTKEEELNVVVTGAGSFDKYSACRAGGCHAIRVETKTCSDLLDEQGVPYYFKTDIEGRDIGCLKNIMANRCGSSQLPKYISFENFGLDTFAEYFELSGNGDWKGLLKMMHKRGYTMWKRARTWQREYISQFGQMGSESAFGEDLLDLEVDKVWKPTSEFADKLGCDVNCTMAGNCEGYCDMHAKLDEALSDQDCLSRS